MVSGGRLIYNYHIAVVLANVSVVYCELCDLSILFMNYSCIRVVPTIIRPKMVMGG